MVKIIAAETRSNIQKVLDELLKNNPIIEKAAAFKKTDGAVYASIGFGEKDVGRFTFACARIFQNAEIASGIIGKSFRKLSLPGGIIITPAGITTLLVVVVSSEKGHRSMAGNTDKSINQAAGLIEKIM